jgi:hypothetical protein
MLGRSSCFAAFSTTCPATLFLGLCTFLAVAPDQRDWHWHCDDGVLGVTVPLII